MDTNKLIQEAKARFNHKSAKAYLHEKYSNKLLIAEQGGLWKADPQTITLLQSFNTKKVILIDTFDNIVEVDRKALLDKLKDLYQSVMQQWHDESKELEAKR
jgi:hypothetical protein